MGNNERKLSDQEMEFNDGQLTVRELIEKLKKFRQDAPVWHEGCDCFGSANGVEIREHIGVLITRND